MKDTLIFNSELNILIVYRLGEKKPVVGKSSYVHEQATVIGSVTIGEQCFIGAQAVLRADDGEIFVGDRTSIQENSTIHEWEKERTTIGTDVQVGHGAVLHTCTVKDFAVVGMNATVSDHAIVGRWAIVGEGAVVPARMVVPDETIVVGNPAKVLRPVNEHDKNFLLHYKRGYVELAERYQRELRRI